MLQVTRGLIAAISIFLIADVAVAATTLPNTFSSGTAAKASEVNANFQALATAIDTLSARVDKLDGTAPVTMENLAGTYDVHGVETQLSNATSDPLNNSITNITIKGTLTLNADGTGSISEVDAGHTMGFQAVTPPATTITQINNSIPGTLTWSLTNGRLAMFGVEFSIVSGGRLLIKTSGNLPPMTTSIVILTRQN